MFCCRWVLHEFSKAGWHTADCSYTEHSTTDNMEWSIQGMFWRHYGIGIELALAVVKRLKERIVSSQSYGASPATWDHTVLSATRHKWTCPALTPASKLVLDLPTPDGLKGWVDLGYPAGSQTRDRSLDHKSDTLTTTPPSRPMIWSWLVLGL